MMRVRCDVPGCVAEADARIEYDDDGRRLWTYPDGWEENFSFQHICSAHKEKA